MRVGPSEIDTAAAFDRVEADDCARKLRAPGADQARDAKDLARVEGEADVRRSGPALSPRPEAPRRRPCLRALWRADSPSARPTIMRISSSREDPSPASSATRWPSRSTVTPVADAEDLVQMVRDVDDATPRRLRRVDHREQQSASPLSTAVGSSMMRTRPSSESARAVCGQLLQRYSQDRPRGRTTGKDTPRYRCSSCARRSCLLESTRRRGVRSSWPRKMFSATVSCGTRLSPDR